MNRILQTNRDNWAALIARLALGMVVFPHGAQKLFGWFGGYGFEGTMNYMTGQGGLSYFIALLVIMIESIGALMLVFGFLTRIAALGILGLFSIIMVQYHASFGFFMNWAGTQKGEGIEYFILLLALALILIITGGGKASLDNMLFKNKINKQHH